MPGKRQPPKAAMPERFIPANPTPPPKPAPPPPPKLAPPLTTPPPPKPSGMPPRMMSGMVNPLGGSAGDIAKVGQEVELLVTTDFEILVAASNNPAHWANTLRACDCKAMLNKRRETYANLEKTAVQEGRGEAYRVARDRLFAALQRNASQVRAFDMLEWDLYLWSVYRLFPAVFNKAFNAATATAPLDDRDMAGLRSAVSRTSAAFLSQELSHFADVLDAQTNKFRFARCIARRIATGYVQLPDRVPEVCQPGSEYDEFACSTLFDVSGQKFAKAFVVPTQTTDELWLCVFGLAGTYGFDRGDFNGLLDPAASLSIAETAALASAPHAALPGVKPTYPAGYDFWGTVFAKDQEPMQVLPTLYAAPGSGSPGSTALVASAQHLLENCRGLAYEVVRLIYVDHVLSARRFGEEVSRQIVSRPDSGGGPVPVYSTNRSDPEELRRFGNTIESAVTEVRRRVGAWSFTDLLNPVRARSIVLDPPEPPQPPAKRQRPPPERGIPTAQFFFI